jgi:hypothetical protein
MNLSSHNLPRPSPVARASLHAAAAWTPVRSRPQRQLRQLTSETDIRIAHSVA